MDFLVSSLLEGLPWIQHGFGTRHAQIRPDDFAGLKQIHSNLVLMADRKGMCGEADGLLTDRPGLAVAVRTADCYPILLADTRNHAIAAVHAGWRGTATHIIDRTLEEMAAQFGTSPSDVHAAIGPGIGACCYEVGEEVAGQFGLPAVRTHLDLARENRKSVGEGWSAGPKYRSARRLYFLRRRALFFLPPGEGESGQDDFFYPN